MTMRYLQLASVLTCYLATALADEDQCRLVDIPVQPNFDQSRFAGVWYQIELYSTRQQNQFLQDFSQRVSEVTSGRIRVDTYYRRDRYADCSPVITSFRNQTRLGHYRDTREMVVEGITADENIIVYTDYERFAVEFVCDQAYYGLCRDPKVIFWSRTKRASDNDLAALGRQLLSRLCVDERQRYQIVQDLVSTCNRRVNRQCRFDDIPVADPFSSARTTGVWYVVRTYPFGGSEPFEIGLQDDYAYVVDGPCLQATINFRNKKTNQCINPVQVSMRELKSGVFEFFHPTLKRPVRFKAVFASDNRNFGIMFECFDFRGDICINPGVRFVSRGKPVLTSGELAELEAFIKDLCVDPSVYGEPVQREACPSISKAPECPTNRKTPDVKPENDQGPSYNFQDLLRAQKEMLRASRDKLRVETETLRLRKEQIELQIQHLRARFGY